MGLWMEPTARNARLLSKRLDRSRSLPQRREGRVARYARLRALAPVAQGIEQWFPKPMRRRFDSCRGTFWRRLMRSPRGATVLTSSHDSVDAAKRRSWPTRRAEGRRAHGALHRRYGRTRPTTADDISTPQETAREMFAHGFFLLVGTQCG